MVSAQISLTSKLADEIYTNPVTLSGFNLFNGKNNKKQFFNQNEDEKDNPENNFLFNI